MNDLDRARAHLKQAEQGGDAGDATAEAAIASGYALLALADRLGPVLDTLIRPLRVAVPTHPVVQEDEEWWRSRLNRSVAARDPEAVRAAADGLNRVREAEAYGDTDPAGSAERARLLDLAAESERESAHARGTGGVFGQMEERPNALEDQGEH